MQKRWFRKMENRGSLERRMKPKKQFKDMIRNRTVLHEEDRGWYSYQLEFMEKLYKSVGEKLNNVLMLFLYEN